MRSVRVNIAVCLFLGAAACTGGEGDPAAPTNAAPPAPPVSSTPPPSESLTMTESAVLLTQATFGATTSSVSSLENNSASEWYVAQLNMTPTSHLANVLAQLPNGTVFDDSGDRIRDAEDAATNSFWEAAISADDQLRQRMAYALSQIIVTSGGGGSPFRDRPHTQAAYMDILVNNAFGNYRELLEDITYSVAMAEYLTYLRNQKGNPSTGRVPDENYARELMQLFAIGLVELNPDGTPRLVNGEEVETYTNEDVTGLARVFTGLSFNAPNFNSRERERAADALYTPLIMFDDRHSELEKTFLGTTIPANTAGVQSIDLALDAIFAHPNVAPFVSRQLIQRFITSNPPPEYVGRVAAAFEAGSFTLPNGTAVGDGRRGDLAATLAAILFDNYARDAALRAADDYGKIREPALRFIQWARAFKVNSADASDERALRDTSGTDSLGQHPFRAPSVFNFYRPGFVAPGTATGNANITAPELQITNAASSVGYANFMTDYIFVEAPTISRSGRSAFLPDYSDEIFLAEDAVALIDHLDTLLTNGSLAPESKARMVEIINEVPVEAASRGASLDKRAQLAVLLVMTTPEYIIQQ